MTVNNLTEGIKLKCINAEGKNRLKVGATYTFDKHDVFENRVYIKEYKRFSFLLSRFEVISS